MTCITEFLKGGKNYFITWHAMIQVLDSGFRRQSRKQHADAQVRE
jgi:hypothetical protein